MKKLVYYLSFAVLSVMLTACGSSKNVAYMQNSDYISYDRSEVLYDAQIMPKDILTITVNTVNPEAAAPFNLIVRNTLQPGSNNIGTGGGSLQTYLVDNAGQIDFPVLGKVHVGGLTKSACEQLIHDRIMKYINAAENPVVTVRMSNYKISVLGEVTRPGMFTVSNEKVNIFEALALAGDLTVYGVRDRVKLIRENAKGRKDIYTLNLNDADIVSSPFYYLRQNDILYVEPNKVKSQNASIGPITTLAISATGLLVSVASLVVNILR